MQDQQQQQQQQQQQRPLPLPPLLKPPSAGATIQSVLSNAKTDFGSR